MSIYAKMVESATIGLRVFLNLGGDGENGNEGFWFGYRKQQLYAKFAGNTGITIDSDWHHYAATSNGSTLKVYFDEREVASKDVALDLVVSSKYSTMAIGETHTGKSNIARAGEWLFDEVVFGSGVLSFDMMRAPCLSTPPAAPTNDAEERVAVQRGCVWKRVLDFDVVKAPRVSLVPATDGSYIHS
eukprot:gene6251-9584_t